MQKNGAVGDICLHFYDANGKEVKEPLGNRVIGIDLERLRRVRDRVGIAGGKNENSLRFLAPNVGNGLTPW